MSPKSQSFLRHTAIYGLGAILLQAVGLILLPIHTRYLAPADFGFLQILFRIGDVLNIVLMFQGIGLATLNFFKLPDHEAGERHIAASASLFLVVVGCGGMVLATLCVNPLALFLDLQGREPTLLLGIGCVLTQGFIVMPLTLMQARLESGWYVAAMFGIALSRCLLTLLLVVWGGWGLVGVLLAFGLSHALFGIGFSLRETLRTSFRPQWTQVVAIARFALPFLPTGLCFFVIESGDQVLLSRFQGNDEVGFYGLGNQVARLATLFVIVPVFKVWQTWRYRAYESERRADLFGEALTRIAFVYAFAALGLLVLRDFVVLLLGSATYEPSRTVIGPLLLAHLFMGAAKFFDAPFHICSRTDLKPWIALASSCVIMTLYLAWIPAYGRLGAAYATLWGMLFHAAATYWVAQRVMRINLEWKRLAWLFALTIPCGLLLIFFHELRWLPLRLTVLLLWLTFFWRSSLLSPPEKQHILGWSHRLLSYVRAT